MEHGVPQALSEELPYYSLHNIWLMLYELWKRRQSLYEATDTWQIPEHPRDEIRDTFDRLYKELKRRDKIEDDKKSKIMFCVPWEEWEEVLILLEKGKFFWKEEGVEDVEKVYERFNERLKRAEQIKE